MAEAKPPQPATYILNSWTALSIPTSQHIEDDSTPAGKEWLSAMKILKKDQQEGFLSAAFGRVVEAPETVWLVTAWQTQSSLDAFENSSAWKSQREKLSTISSTPPTTQHVHSNGQFWTGLSDNIAITDVFFPASLSPQARQQAERVRGLVYFVAPGRSKPAAYAQRGNRGWVQDEVEYDGQQCKVLRFWDYWKSRESEEEFKRSAGIMTADGMYVALVEYRETQLKEAGMLGMRELHCGFVEVPRFFS